MKIITDNIAYQIFIRLLFVLALCAFIFFGMIWIGAWFVPFFYHSFNSLWELWAYKP